ncbi:MAG: hypothetical protein AAF519_07080 [Bacteroidota bacterium]
MDTKKLKNSWQRYKLNASLDRLASEQVVGIIRASSEVNRSYRLISSLALFILLLLGLQSG